ncbi:hypothetical protein ABKN59_002523 [Abortiporus biennis]
MSVLSHFIKPLPVARRAYSVFSKPGGGRYFNAAKPPASQANKKVDVSSSSDNASSLKDEAGTSQSSTTPVVPDAPSLASLSLPRLNATPQPIHPPLNPLDLKLHQFFSLHRPLLSISQPTASLFETSMMPFNVPPPPKVEQASVNTIDDPPESSPESDADAARQLARAFVVNKVGATVTWEAALQRLGLDVTAERAEEISLAEAEYEVLMDSTKRKRRKKMKKHKLKKRRRLTRSTRLKIGR